MPCSSPLRPGTRPPWAGPSSRGTCPTGPAPERRSTWSWLRAPWPSSGAATTRSRRGERRPATPDRLVLRGARRGDGRRGPARSHPRCRPHPRRAPARKPLYSRVWAAQTRTSLHSRRIPMDQAATLTPERLLRRLEWHVVRRLDGRLQGDYRTLFRGTGVDFTDLREYEPGDDLRHIDWNVTARMDTPFVREYVEDREVTAWLLLDRSASMAFGPVDRQKSLVLAEIATTIAHILARGGNRVGAVLFGSEVEQTIPPASGRNQVLRIARELIDPPTAAAPGTTTDLAVLLR